MTKKKPTLMLPFSKSELLILYLLSANCISLMKNIYRIWRYILLHLLWTFYQNLSRPKMQQTTDFFKKLEKERRLLSYLTCITAIKWNSHQDCSKVMKENGEMRLCCWCFLTIVHCKSFYVIKKEQVCR